MTDDTRVTCYGCTNRQRGQGGLMACMQPKRAGLTVPPRATYLELGSALATLPQHCPAYVAKPSPKPSTKEPAHASA